MHLRFLNLVLQSATIALLLLFVAVFWYDISVSQLKNDYPEGFCGVITPTYSYNYVLPDGMEVDPAKGKTLWNENACGACHIKNMKDDGTGPALGGVVNRWADFPREDLYAWVRNSQKMVDAGHPRAIRLFDDWGVLMQSYPDLSDQEIEHLLAYIEGVSNW